MRKVLAGLPLGLLLLVFGLHSAHAETCGCMGKMEKGVPMIEGMHQRGMERMEAEQRIWRRLRELGLNEQQKAEIRDILSRQMKDTIRRKGDILISRIELRDILRKDPLDMGAVEAKLRQIAAMQTDLRLSHIKAREEIKAKLTPEQRKEFKENLKKRWKGTSGTCEQK